MKLTASSQSSTFTSEAMIKFLVPFVAFFGCGSASESQLWLKTLITEGTLASGNSISMQTPSKLMCSARTFSRPSVSLFCYNADNGTCTLSDLKVAPRLDESLLGPVVNCWTKHPCVVDGIAYDNGDEFSYNCFPMICQNYEAKINMPVPSSCSAPFSQHASGIGCVAYFPENKAWCDARSHCRSFGGDLVVNHDVNVLSAWHSAANPSSSDVWLGIDSGIWLDGVTVVGWGIGQPNGDPDECAYIESPTSGIHDRVCTRPYAFLCQLDV